jgi:2-keto-4-pentenoate hydratase/2-oxohepta-3-ene-1,7-dioic acid hydratase in catechol pathway
MNMAFGIEYLIRYISHVMTLMPGDVIATGTPAGVSRLEPGDTVEVEVNHVGVLRNTVGRA